MNARESSAQTSDTPGQVAGPLAHFARLVGGEWQLRFESGTSQFETWTWGPDNHSIRIQNTGAEANGDPWRDIQLMYWHPGLEQVRVLGLQPHGGVLEGWIRFDGETARAEYDLYQPGQPLRQLRVRWAFHGPDRYRETLLETTRSDSRPVLAGLPSDDLKLLAEWDHARSTTLTEIPLPPHRN